MSELADETENGRFSLAASPGFKQPPYVHQKAVQDGSVYVVTTTTLLYEYLDDKVSYIKMAL